MKKPYVLLLASAIALVPMTRSFAQVGLGSVTWDVSGALSDQKDYVDTISLRGFGFDGRSYISRHFSLGLSFDWQVWDDQTSDPVELEGGTLTGKQYRYINAFPFLLNLHLYAGDVHEFRIFLGAGVGAMYIMDKLQFGLANIEDNDWYFGGAPEMGFLIPLDEIYFVVAGRVYYAVRSMNDTEDARMWWTAKVGIAYDRW